MRIRLRLLCGFTTFSWCIALLANPAQSQTCPPLPIAAITSADVPSDVCIPENFGGNPIEFFDDFSWRAFVALMWPAAKDQRGVPDKTATLKESGPRVFETYKSIWEIFHNDGSAPAPWNVYDKPQFNACNAPASFGDLVIASFSKFSELGQAGFGSLVGPLVAQNQTYTRYTTGFNETEFNQIAQDRLHIRNNLPMKRPFQDGALDIKAAWMLMKDVPHPERYYKRTALVLDPETAKCSAQLVGLVGLHIVHKTPSRPQWIWSTFEQVDNVPPAVSGSLGRFNYNDGKGGPMPAGNPYPIDPLKLPTPAPFNVDRNKSAPIHPSTVNTNLEYRNALKTADSVLQFYQLVMTQWPLEPNKPALPGTPNNTFPGGNATSAFANVTMESFEQRNIVTGCMNCHNVAKTQTDFLWSLRDHAFPANVPNFIGDESFRGLQELLTTTAPISKFTPHQ
jgi:hypothetical protein